MTDADEALYASKRAGRRPRHTGSATPAGAPRALAL